MVTIESMEFRGVNKSTFGFLIYDLYSQAYDNSLKAFEGDDLKILKAAIACENEAIQDMLYRVQKEQLPLFINGTWYDWRQVKFFLEKP